MTKKAQTYGFILVAALAVIAVFVVFKDMKEAGEDVFPAPDAQTMAFLQNTFKEAIHLKPGLAIPDVVITTKGGEINFQDLQGPMLINLWAVWCVPCVKELPSLEKLHNKYPGLPIQAIALDRNADIAYIDAFLQKNNIGEFAAYVTPMQPITSAFSLHGIPTTIIIDGNNRVRYILAGETDWAQPAIHEFLQGLLENKQ